MAGLETVPLLLMEAAGAEALELAVIENLQRSDLNPIEEASAYVSMMARLGLTQEEVAARAGKDRSTVANYVRLLKLPAEVQEGRRGGEPFDGARPRASLPPVGRREEGILTGGSEKRAISKAARGPYPQGACGEGRQRRKYPHLVKGGGPAGPQALFLRDIRERLRARARDQGPDIGRREEGKDRHRVLLGENLEGIIEKLV